MQNQLQFVALINYNFKNAQYFLQFLILLKIKDSYVENLILKYTKG